MVPGGPQTVIKSAELVQAVVAEVGATVLPEDSGKLTDKVIVDETSKEHRAEIGNTFQGYAQDFRKRLRFQR